METSRNPYGILDFLAWDHDWNQNHYPIEKVHRAARLMREAGAGIVRLDFLWSDVEPEPGHFDFAKYAERVGILRDEGLEILGLLHYNPSWRQVPWNQSPDPERYALYAKKVVEEFKTLVRYWEIWNEPDHPKYWQAQDGLHAYANLLKKVYPKLKDANPDCLILMGGLSSPAPHSLRQIYAQAGRDSFDIVNIHSFASPPAQDAMMRLRQTYDAVRRIMEEYEDVKKPVWFTEVGCPGTPHGCPAPAWWLGENPSESQQADWVRALCAEVPSWNGVEKIFWAFFRDTVEHFKDGVDYLGLVRNDFSLKPAYAAFKQFANSASR